MRPCGQAAGGTDSATIVSPVYGNVHDINPPRGKPERSCSSPPGASGMGPTGKDESWVVVNGPVSALRRGVVANRTGRRGARPFGAAGLLDLEAGDNSHGGFVRPSRGPAQRCRPASTTRSLIGAKGRSGGGRGALAKPVKASATERSKGRAQCRKYHAQGVLFLPVAIALVDAGSLHRVAAANVCSKGIG
jgi:hypothetical protein